MLLSLYTHLSTSIPISESTLPLGLNPHHLGHKLRSTPSRSQASQSQAQAPIWVTSFDPHHLGHMHLSHKHKHQSRSQASIHTILVTSILVTSTSINLPSFLASIRLQSGKIDTHELRSSKTHELRSFQLSTDLSLCCLSVWVLFVCRCVCVSVCVCIFFFKQVYL